MKRLIVNGDDFGLSRGVNRGLIDAHREGILTSASMMVEAPASGEAAELTAAHPALSIGLHVVLDLPGAQPEHEVERQLARFVELVGRPPTHLDSHHNVHQEEPLLGAFRSVAARHALPLRGHSQAHPIMRFYGQVDPQTLAHILATDVGDGFNELCCHPGYADEELVSSYSRERQDEVQTLCDAGVAAQVEACGIELASFRDLPA
jgi:chitin disaccharide deacetylase